MKKSHIALIIAAAILAIGLLAGDKDLQAKIKTMLQDGVKIQACQACTDSYGITEQLRNMGIDVKYMGKPLTDLIQQNWHILTF